MNRKQKIILWIGGVLISIIFLLNEPPLIAMYWADILRFVIPILIITGLLFITFKKD